MDLPNGGNVKKYHVALFLNSGTENVPSWTQIKKSTSNTITMNAQTQEYDFITDEIPTTELDRYQPSLTQPLFMKKGEPDFEFIFDKFFNQATGNASKTDMLIVFLFANESETVYKAWKTKCGIQFSDFDPVNSTINFDVPFSGTTDKGTVDLASGVPVYSSATESAFMLTVNVEDAYEAPVENASVYVGSVTATTNASGEATVQVKDGVKIAIGAESGLLEGSTLITASKLEPTATVTIA